MKTDLSKILSISGQSGLYSYVSQAKTGAIVESLETGKRTCCTFSSKISSLEDISIYTNDDEVRLSEVLLKMKEEFSAEQAVSHKAPEQEIRAIFEKVLPDYDRDRFYISHMRKVVQWYNILVKHASLDFVTDQDRESETAQHEQ